MVFVDKSTTSIGVLQSLIWCCCVASSVRVGYFIRTLIYSHLLIVSNFGQQLRCLQCSCALVRCIVPWHALQIWRGLARILLSGRNFRPKSSVLQKISIYESFLQKKVKIRYFYLICCTCTVTMVSGSELCGIIITRMSNCFQVFGLKICDSASVSQDPVALYR